jgi:hypothetical protein
MLIILGGDRINNSSNFLVQISSNSLIILRPTREGLGNMIQNRGMLLTISPIQSATPKADIFRLSQLEISDAINSV